MLADLLAHYKAVSRQCLRCSLQVGGTLFLLCCIGIPLALLLYRRNLMHKARCNGSVTVMQRQCTGATYARGARYRYTAVTLPSRYLMHKARISPEFATGLADKERGKCRVVRE